MTRHGTEAKRPASTRIRSWRAHDELRAHAKSLIAGYKARRSLEIVDKLPLSGSGKVLKRDLRRKHRGDQERQIH